MRVREERKLSHRRRTEEEATGGPGAGTDASRATDLRDEIDDLLGEIDGFLEENAEEFVKGYVQKGGE